MGTREIFFAVVSTTATLAAVFIPISFLPGQAGGIFSEFGLVLAFSVALSSAVSLTLCPVLCALLDPGRQRASLTSDAAATDAQQVIGAGTFDRLIEWVLRWRFAILVVVGLLAGLVSLLYVQLPKEITPREDRGLFFVTLRTPASASLEYTSAQATEVENMLAPFIERGDVRAVQSMVGRRGQKNEAWVIVRLELWERRNATQQQIMAELQKPLSGLAGAIVSMRSPNSLGIRGAGSGLQFAVTGSDYDRLSELTAALIEKMKNDPTFTNPQLTYDTNQPQLALDIDRDLAADLGLSPPDLIALLNTIIDGESVATLFLDNESVDVKLETGGRPVDDQTDLENVFVKTGEGRFIPISSVATMKEVADASTLVRERRQPSVPAQANLGPGIDLGRAAARLAEIAPEVLGADGRVILLGEAALLQESESGTLLVFAAAILIVFLVLSAQFESFSSAWIIILTVPFGLAAALVAILLSGGSLNYYSQIGLVMLVGIMAKNGILIIEFANQLRERGADVDSAIRQAMKLRVRPVMMTIVSTVCGALPLIITWGAGAEARSAVGWVIVGGLGFATIFTLFLTPALYRIIAPLSAAPGASQRRLDEEVTSATIDESGEVRPSS